LLDLCCSGVFGGEPTLEVDENHFEFVAVLCCSLNEVDTIDLAKLVLESQF
jgi:hypothetical protein